MTADDRTVEQRIALMRLRDLERDYVAIGKGSATLRDAIRLARGFADRVSALESRLQQAEAAIDGTDDVRAFNRWFNEEKLCPPGDYTSEQLRGVMYLAYMEGGRRLFNCHADLADKAESALHAKDAELVTVTAQRDRAVEAIRGLLRAVDDSPGAAETAGAVIAARDVLASSVNK